MYSSRILDTSNKDWMAESRGGRGRCLLFFPNKDDAAFAKKVLDNAEFSGLLLRAGPVLFHGPRKTADYHQPRTSTAGPATPAPNASAPWEPFPAPALPSTVESPATPAPAAPVPDLSPRTSLLPQRKHKHKAEDFF
ncbi:hypothetical protein PG989_015034 [Apiospora arundinis]